LNVHWTRAFAADYSVEVVQDLPHPGTMRHFYYPPASRSGHDGVTVQVAGTRMEPWIGTFAFGALSPKGISGVFAMPNAGQLCVVSRGRGFVVSATDPATYQELQCHPIVDVRPIPRWRIMIFANFTEMLAYGQDGIQWRTARLSWDGFKITEVTDTCIQGEFWDIRSEQPATFTVDLATGKHQGGARVPR
jgi:hypothetical protein